MFLTVAHVGLERPRSITPRVAVVAVRTAGAHRPADQRGNRVDLGGRRVRASPRLLVRRQDCRGEIRPLKSEQSRRDIPLSPDMARRLGIERGSRADSGRVFTSPQGFPLAYGNVRRRVLVPAVEAAGLPWVTFHTFRHTCASLLFEAGRDVKQVSEWLGHADAGFTLKAYVHLKDAGVGDVAFMDELVAPSTEGSQG